MKKGKIKGTGVGRGRPPMIERERVREIKKRKKTQVGYKKTPGSWRVARARPLSAPWKGLRGYGRIKG